MRTLEGHEDVVNSVACSADGERVVSGSEDKTIKIWHEQHDDLRWLAYYLQAFHGDSAMSIINHLGDIAIDRAFDLLLTADHKNRLLWAKLVTKRDPGAMNLVKFLVSIEPSLSGVVDPNSKRDAYDEASAEVKLAIDQALCFCGRFKFTSGIPLHKSRTCVVLSAIDRLDDDRPVVLKSMKFPEQFERELFRRGWTSGDDGDWSKPPAEEALDPQFVVGIEAQHSGPETVAAVRRLRRLVCVVTFVGAHRLRPRTRNARPTTKAAGCPSRYFNRTSS
ncbi:MAG: WD40 repeat domain-containing protein [Acidimicrobiales bacterium]|nr:WD40 repeat domain-containing protein [Acidimicrobiales bacterium]